MIRKFSSKDKPEEIDTLSLPFPTYWLRPFKGISEKEGHHRFVWDLHYPEPKGVSRQLNINANYKNTATSPRGPWVQPGIYKVRLTVDGVTREEALSVRMDPRVETDGSDLTAQWTNSMKCFNAYNELQTV